MLGTNDSFHRGGFGSEQIDKCFTKLGETTEPNGQHQKMDKEEEKKRGTLWHFLENECGGDERELVRDFLLPTAAALALSLPQVSIASPLLFHTMFWG